MNDNKITIVINKGKITGIPQKPISIRDAILIFMTVLRGWMDATVKTAPVKAKDQIKMDLYDYFNKAASVALEEFAPEIERKPDITVDALLKAENDLIDARYREAKQNERNKGLRTLS